MNGLSLWEYAVKRPGLPFPSPSLTPWPLWEGPGGGLDLPSPTLSPTDPVPRALSVVAGASILTGARRASKRKRRGAHTTCRRGRQAPLGELPAAMACCVWLLRLAAALRCGAEGLRG